MEHKLFVIEGGLVSGCGSIELRDNGFDPIAFQYQAAKEHQAALDKKRSEWEAQEKKQAHVRELHFVRRVTYKQGIKALKVNDTLLYAICMTRVEDIDIELEGLL